MTTQQEQIKQHYLEISGFSDVVANLIPELEGLNTDNYFNWYFTKSKWHYYRNSVWGASNPLMKYAAKSRAGAKLLYRREPRMYVRRKLIKRKQDTIHYYEHFKQVFSNAYAHQKRVCNDAKLILATTLYDFAIELTEDIAVLRQVRLGLDLDRSHKISSFRGIYDNDEDFTGKRIARIEFFRQILAEFEQQIIQAPQVPSTANVPNPTATGLPIDAILSIPRRILDQLLLGVTMVEPAVELGRFKALPQVKPWQWANVRAALREKLLIAEISDAEAAAFFKETYGAEVGRTTMQHNPQVELGNKRKTRRVLAYTTILSNLETLITPVKSGF